MATEITGRISKLDRLPNSTAGNPMYRVHTSTLIPLYTAADTQAGHEISNYLGARVVLALDSMGRITGVRPHA
jgi:hypothetical protein